MEGHEGVIYGLHGNPWRDTRVSYTAYMGIHGGTRGCHIRPTWESMEGHEGVIYGFMRIHGGTRGCHVRPTWESMEGHEGVIYSLHENPWRDTRVSYTAFMRIHGGTRGCHIRPS